MAFTGATVAPPANAALFMLAASGSLVWLAFGRPLVHDAWRRHRALLLTAVLLAAAILWSEGVARLRGTAPPHDLPPQVGLLLCLPALALFLHDRRNFRIVVLVFAAACLWHLFAMPIEAIHGVKLGWHPVEWLPRAAGPFRFQASGLARQAYFFPGLFLPLFYLAWGPLYEKRVFPQWPLGARAMLALPLVWLIPVLSVQSRSAFAGALAAALLAIAGARRALRPRQWFALAALALAGAAVFWLLFAENKSGVELRLAYFAHYIRTALDWEWLATGRSLYFDPDMRMAVPGLQKLQHSHNDIAQVFYSWGLPGLAAYLAFWVALVRLVWTRFAARGEWWPACALVALLPNMLTDLGFQHYEKAAFLVLLAAFCMALEPRAAPAAREEAAPLRP